MGRVDDLWSLLYMILEFLTGTLPWKGKNKETIGTLKVELTNVHLFSEPCPLLIKIYDYLKTLRYLDKPNYDYICDCFDDILEEISATINATTVENMELNSLDSTEEILSPKTRDDDEIPPMPMTSPQIEKIENTHYMIDTKESATLFEPLDFSQIPVNVGTKSGIIPR